MNANARDFDPNRIPSSGYNPSEQQQAVDATGGGSYHVGIVQQGEVFYPYPPAAEGGGAYYDPSTGYQQPQYVDPSAAGAGFYQQQYPPTQAEYLNPPAEEAWGTASDQAPGSYFPVESLKPQLFGAPISALAYDEDYEAIYVTSHTQPLGLGQRRGHVASMMVTHSTLDGSLYSSVAAHPVADSTTLDSVYGMMYGGGGTASSSRRKAHIPPHAYQPHGIMEDSTTGSFLGKSQMGITTLMPMNDGYVASVSPSAVRVHSNGGLCISDHDIQGMVCGTILPGGMHVSVGGAEVKSQKSHVHCMDLYHGLRTVSSKTFRSEASTSVPFGVMCMATNNEKRTLLVGCSDGTLRLLDGSWRARGGSELAKVKSHAAGVSNVAVSNDGNLVCTTGFSSRPSVSSSNQAPYVFPDQQLYIYDVRYLGRGGIHAPFSGVKGAPRLIAFLPDTQDQPRNRILVASGQAQGGIQIITPFEHENRKHAKFLMPRLVHRESMTALHVSEQYLAIGTSQCNVLQFEMSGFTKPTHFFNSSGEFVPSDTFLASGKLSPAPPKEKKPLVLPPFVPEPPPLSMAPGLLQSSGPGIRNGPTDKLKSIFTAYIMNADPRTSGSAQCSAFSSFANDVLLRAPKRNVSNQLLQAASKQEGDVMSTVLPSKLDIDLLADDRTDRQKSSRIPVLPNPNRMLYSKKLNEVCYEKTEARGGRRGRERRAGANSRNWRDEADDENGVPKRYRRTVRPAHAGAGFSCAQYNDTSLWPGWDYAPTMPNAYAPPVLLWLYFVPEIRSIMLSRQFDSRLYSSNNWKAVPTLSTELGFLFHQIESLSQYARMYPGDIAAKVGAFVPTNFLASFSTMPEAEALALLDGAPAAVETARRPEAFFRFLLHHLNKELSNKKISSSCFDSLYGFNFVSVNEFITGSGKPTVSKQPAMTVDLSYDPFVKDDTRIVKFGEVLRHALSKESRLRAWCEESRSYETVVQRKIATSLPTILALSCCCAGTKNEEGLSIWRNHAPENGHWLPEMVEVELEENGNVIVRELMEGGSDKVWVEFKGSSKLPSSIADIVKSSLGSVRKHRYRLDAVLSFVRDDLDMESTTSSSDEEAQGHHVLHARITSDYKRRAYEKQQTQVEQLASSMEESQDSSVPPKLTLTSSTEPQVFRERAQDVSQRLESLNKADSDWVLFNGFCVSHTVVEDAQAFHVPFKEPCLVIFRTMDDEDRAETAPTDYESSCTIQSSVMRTKSISTNRPPDYQPATLPGRGDLIAFDAEFVSVQDEESVLSYTGSKITVRETRYALGRISVMDCASGSILIDDHVLPVEPVVDYLTRFSGIVEADLDPKTSPHHLISMRSAYLKLRCLTERGCIFVGHGLSQDFLTVNLVVPPCQIIDTVEIYHQPKMRWISLRFLTNYVFQKDVQQDVHDSVEDARAAYALYQKALQLKHEDKFETYLQELYVYGAARDWKLGVD